MRRLLGVFVLATLACGGGRGASADDYHVALTDPWTGMALPVADGAVKFADSSSASVEYSSGTLEDLAKKYAEVIKAGGWTETAASEAGGMFTATYGKNGKTLTLSVISAGGTTTVSLVQT